MGLGAGAVAAMQKAYNQNRALAKGSKRSLKDIPTSGTSVPKGKPLVYNKLNDKEYELFKVELKLKKKKENNKSIVIFIVSTLIVVSLYFYMIS